MHTVYYTGDFKPVERCERKLDGVVDVWLRRNPATDDDGAQVADELYLQFSIDRAPTYDELLENVDTYFENDATPETTIQDIVDALNELTTIILGGE